MRRERIHVKYAKEYGDESNSEKEGISMTTDSERNISKWKYVSELRTIEKDISALGYSRDFIIANGLYNSKSPHESNMITGRVDFWEALEVKEENGKVYYRENDDVRRYREEPDFFETQFGTFNNHNHGEFDSWLGKEGYKGRSAEEKKMDHLYGRSDFFIEGNYCDMFDCGEYTYAISNLMHMGLGLFKIVRIDGNLNALVLYDNQAFTHTWTCYEYAGYYQNEKGYVVIFHGFDELDRGQDEKRDFQSKTIFFQIDYNGKCYIDKEWPIRLSSPNSFAVLGEFIYFGQNKMITRINMQSGETVFFTNKTEQEIAALDEVF